MKKKAQLSSLQGVILTFLVIAIVLGIGLYVVTQMKTTMLLSPHSNSVANESLTGDTGAIYYLNASELCGFVVDNSSAILLNESASTVVFALGDNYTLSENGEFLLQADSTFNNSALNITYSYTYGGQSCNALNDTTTAISGIPTWFTIIVVVFIAGIILAIVFRVLPSGSRESGFGSLSGYKGSGGGWFGGGSGSSGTTAEI